MNIVLVIGALGAGGAERVAVTLVNAWAARGDSVTLVSTYSGRGECFYQVSEKVRIVYLADVVGTTRKGLVSSVKRFLALRKIFRESRADVLVSFLLHVNTAAIAASRWIGIPIVACEHSNPVASTRTQKQKLLARLLYPKADVLTVLTEGVVSPLKAEIPRLENIAVMPNPLPEDVFCFQRTESVAGRKRLIAVGRLLELKQFDLLIEIFSSLESDFPQWDLYIWGEGPQRPALEQQIRDLGLTDRVILAGSTQAIWSEMCASDAFALTSEFEGLPMAMMEAMAIGLPCVSFDCPSGPRELTRNGQDGLLVPHGDVVQFREELKRLMGDQVLRMSIGGKGAASVRARYSITNVLTMWDQLFARTIKARAVL
ncbi:glycosyltransferase family 4 protein [Burkholderia sp. PU8-34]